MALMNNDYLVSHDNEDTVFNNDRSGAEDRIVEALNEGANFNDIEVFLVTKQKLDIRVTGVEFWRGGNRVG